MLIVQKYGGTSVANIERIASVAERIKAAHNAGNRLVVVVSALAGETDRLIRLAGNFTCTSHPRVSVDFPPANEIPVCAGMTGVGKSDILSTTDRELDVVVSTGEQTASGLLALALRRIGVNAVTLLSFQIPIITDGVYGRGRIDTVATDRIESFLEKGCVVVVPGFQGISPDGDITTLGRGGSDTTAVALAAALKADVCEIYSDVDGVYTADPNICSEAKKIERLTYDEMLEIAGAGAKVVQMRAVELAAKYNLPFFIRSSFSSLSEVGTKVCAAPCSHDMEQPLVSAITHTLNEAKISIRRVPPSLTKEDSLSSGAIKSPDLSPAAHIFEPLAKANINVDMIVQNIGADETTDIAFTVEKHDLKKALAIAERAAVRIGAGRVDAAGDVSKVSIIGVGMRSHAGVAAKMFDTLAKNGIGIHLISTSEIRVSVVVDMRHTKLAVEALHKAFNLTTLLE